MPARPEVSPWTHLNALVVLSNFVSCPGSPMARSWRSARSG